jgi:hypothetical protein
MLPPIQEKKELRMDPYESRKPRRKFSNKDILMPTPKKPAKNFWQIMQAYRKEKGLKPVPEFVEPRKIGDPLLDDKNK